MCTTHKLCITYTENHEHLFIRNQRLTWLRRIKKTFDFKVSKWTQLLNFTENTDLNLLKNEGHFHWITRKVHSTEGCNTSTIENIVLGQSHCIMIPYHYKAKSLQMIPSLLIWVDFNYIREFILKKINVDKNQHVQLINVWWHLGRGRNTAARFFREKIGKFYAYDFLSLST